MTNELPAFVKSNLWKGNEQGEFDIHTNTYVTMTKTGKKLGKWIELSVVVGRILSYMIYNICSMLYDLLIYAI